MCTAVSTGTALMLEMCGGFQDYNPSCVPCVACTAMRMEYSDVRIT